MKQRHVLGLSGGRDSAALAVHMRENYPDLSLEYYFSDTGNELPEVYDFLTRMEGFLGKEIVRLNSGRDFDYWLRYYRYYLPSPQARWCTRVMKIEPFLKWIDDDLKNGAQIVNYVAIRADEPGREGLRGQGSALDVRFPFREDGIDKEDVTDILENAGLGLPAYYEWRSRSGCSFCFYQRKIEWIGLLERHPDLFAQAKKYEALAHQTGGGRYTWMANESLDSLTARADEIKAAHEARVEQWRQKNARRQNPLRDGVAADVDEIYGMGKSCVVCHK